MSALRRSAARWFRSMAQTLAVNVPAWTDVLAVYDCLAVNEGDTRTATRSRSRAR